MAVEINVVQARNRAPQNQGNIVPMTAGAIVIASVLTLAVIAVVFRGHNY